MFASSPLIRKIIILLLVWGAWNWALELRFLTADEGNDPGVLLFKKQVAPVLEKHCFACHSGSSKQSGLDLSSREGLLRGGDRGPAIVPGAASSSLLFKLVA